MLNLIKNPNVTSSHLFRADVFYDSTSSNNFHAENDLKGSTLSHLQQKYQPISYELPEFECVRTIVRKLVPRNPQLDRHLIQTCHFFRRPLHDGEQHIVVYIPHVQTPQEMPFYHPCVSRLAFEHKWQPSASQNLTTDLSLGSVSISYCLFESSTVTTKLERTALRLLQMVHKHGQGQLAGYEKRVHLDQVVPQKRYQDTYTRLKAKYGRELAEQWVEVTDPGKHVFEDIGIAAFLIELWKDMYNFEKDTDTKEATPERPKFPGFVDIGCGNGVLVYILLAEGYEGWGFDARERKTWRIFPESVQNYLQRKLLIPETLSVDTSPETRELQHNGIFKPGTFIISNHADELTAWTPLLAYLNKSAFVAIPCCSHDLAGARFRAPLSTKAGKHEARRLPQQNDTNSAKSRASENGPAKPQAAETGSLKRTDAQKKMPSAYSTLCSYVSSLAEELGFEPEKEVLRIPSTRNQCIIGRRKRDPVNFESSADNDQRKRKVADVVERELGRSIDAVRADWVQRAEKLAKKPGSGH